jgi:hypothetical protein
MLHTCISQFRQGLELEYLENQERAFHLLIEFLLSSGVSQESLRRASNKYSYDEPQTHQQPPQSQPPRSLQQLHTQGPTPEHDDAEEQAYQRQRRTQPRDAHPGGALASACGTAADAASSQADVFALRGGAMPAAPNTARGVHLPASDEARSHRDAHTHSRAVDLPPRLPPATIPIACHRAASSTPASHSPTPCSWNEVAQSCGCVVCVPIACVFLCHPPECSASPGA